jgi:DNA adenine methylase
LIDIVRANIKAVKNPYKRAIAMSALIRACLKKRPRIFTYVGIGMTMAVKTC